MSWFKMYGFRAPPNTPSTAGNSMTGSGRPSPEPLLKKEAPPAVLGGHHSGNALEASNALNYRFWGIPAVLSTGIPANALRAFPGSFRNFSGISSGKCQPYWGYGPTNFLRKMLRNFPEIFEPLFCGSEKSHKFPAKFPCKKSKLLQERREK